MIALLRMITLLCIIHYYAWSQLTAHDLTLLGLLEGKTNTIDTEQLNEMASLGYETTQISGLLGISRPTAYRMTIDTDINPAARFSNISDSEVDHRISGI